MEVLYAQTGSLRTAAKISAYIVAWGVARRELGHDPTVEEYAELWRENVRTAYREQAAFREAFPQLENPGPLCDVMERRSSARADFGSLVPAL